MKSLKYTLAALALGATVVSTTSCREDFTDINKNPNQIVTADASMLFTKGIIEFEPSGYLMWYYNAPMMQLWSQLVLFRLLRYLGQYSNIPLHQEAKP